MKIGVMVESFRAGLAGGLAAAAEVGADGVQLYATRGETHPDRLNAAGRKELKQRIADAGLELAAVCGDFGGHGLQNADDNPRRIDDSKKVMDLALELGCDVITTHIGVIPPDKAHPRYAVMAAACRQMGRYGEQVGATFAIETGPETAEVLRAFLDDMPDGIGVNFDPGNLKMVFNEDIPAAVKTLGPYIVHTHAKDGVQLKPVDPVRLYGAFAEQGAAAFDHTRYLRELPLGEGDVPWPEYLAALRDEGYDSYLTIEREVGPDPRGDIARAVTFLRRLLEQA